MPFTPALGRWRHTLNHKDTETSKIIARVFEMITAEPEETFILVKFFFRGLHTSDEFTLTLPNYQNHIENTLLHSVVKGYLRPWLTETGVK